MNISIHTAVEGFSVCVFKESKTEEHVFTSSADMFAFLSNLFAQAPSSDAPVESPVTPEVTAESAPEATV